jgi:desulfoferrodoxin-like iron-binding protein
MANLSGKRYQCTKCNSEFIVTKPGAGTITCCGQPMEIKK